ncbi:MAG TPA: HAMP domain-containing sensor histidine kinase [Vicinamibacterales bacterium]|jgi:signal transduction histidine kinase|nr:HAMP domain-containing sensor histidine kinase [Vicinamibacterales bacterium]
MNISSSLRRIYAAGVVCAILAVAIGFALERARFGSTDADALARGEGSVRDEIAGVVASLTEIASSVAGEPGLFDAAAADPAGARALFDRADQALAGREPGVFAVTAYRASASGTPLAWSGRPSEISVERLSEAEAFFVDSVSLGLRLVYVRPVIDVPSGHRLGMVAAERVLSETRGIRAVSSEVALSLPTLVPANVRPHQSPQDGEHDTFVVTSPRGEPLLDARISTEALHAARETWRSTVAAVALAILALTLIASVPPLLRWRNSMTRMSDRLSALAIVFALFVAARALLWLAPAPDWTIQIFHFEALGPLLRALLRSPVDFLFTMLLAGALVMWGFDIAERARLTMWHRGSAPGSNQERALFALAQLAAGALVALLLIGYEVLLGNAVAATSVDALHFSLHPWDATATARVAFAIAVVLAQTIMLWCGVLVLQLASLPWRMPRTGAGAATAVVLRAIPIAIVAAFPRLIGAAPSTVPRWPTAVAGFACLALAWAFAWVRPRYRHASQALRLFAGALVLLIPAFVLYPSVLHFADRALRRLIEEEYAEQATQQDVLLKQKVRVVLQEIDGADMPKLSGGFVPQPSTPNAALALWSQTELGTERLAASIELYGPDGRLAYRFALNLPEYVSSAQRWREPSCQWEIFEEASPFGSEERRLVHAGRGICDGNSETPSGGSIVVNVMLDYQTLPFITVRSPYYELIRGPNSAPTEGARGRDVEFVVYGWGRGSLYASGGSAWPLDETLLQRIASSRDPFWTTMSNGGRTYSTYILNDRVGIYIIGYPSIAAIDHFINLAELATLVGLTYVALLVVTWLVTVLGGTTAASGGQLLREVRASFYRKLFLAFLVTSVVPVLVLAFFARQFFAAQLRAGINSDAVRVAAVAQRVVEEYVALQQRDAGVAPNDDIMVWLSRAIGQDVNIFHGPQLVATSERDLFDSGLLPKRTPSEVYRAIVIDRLSSSVSIETAGGTEQGYTLAAAPVRVGESSEILTVPLALREQEVEREIDALDRRVLLASMLFALLGAGIGYYMAERIGDPVNRLTRATRRIARGDFSARVVQTSTDELRRLVNDFNRMAGDLQRQRTELERTHRLEAWAEMARQVAHEIKNPLTPIQLSSEHLVRVNKDRGEPLTPVLEECVSAIMSQVKLLRQLSAEFSSFASSPTPHPAPTSLSELLATVLEPYITGLGGRVAIRSEVPASVPMVVVDRMLLARAITNIVENALHAMPGAGSLTVVAEASHGAVRLSFTDTGTGMDPEALRRIFEPYFSTKATGTGLGLTIAKRNVELNGGTIRVQSAPGKGTTVTIELPAARS